MVGMASNYIQSLIKSLVLLSVMISVCCKSTCCHPEQKSRKKISLPKIRYNQHIFHPDLNQKLPEIMSLLHELKDKDRITEYLPIIIRYILKAGKVSVDEIKKAVKSLPKGEETVETTADQLIQEGIKRGIQIGESKGELRGIQIGESRGIQIGESRGIQIGESRGIQIGESRGESRGIQVMINELLQERFDIVHPSISQKIKSIESTETLKALFRKALKIESLQEFDRTIDRVLQPL